MLAAMSNAMACFFNTTSMMSCSTSILAGVSNVFMQTMELVCILALFTVDAVISFDNLLVVLVGIIARTLFAVPLLTIGAAAATLITGIASYKMLAAYYTFMSLAPGSLPANLEGFIQMTAISRSSQSTLKCSGSGHLASLSLRAGPTPFVTGAAPQVQLNKQSPEDVQEYLADRLALFAAMQSDSSSSSSTSDSSKPRLVNCACGFAFDTSSSLRTFGCNACCANKTGGSTHVLLHPSDLETVVQMG